MERRLQRAGRILLLEQADSVIRNPLFNDSVNYIISHAILFYLPVTKNIKNWRLFIERKGGFRWHFRLGLLISK